MLFFYNLGISLYNLLISLLAPFNSKAKLWKDGQRGLLETISKANGRNEKCYWFHFPSLGEFEQGRPVLEKMKVPGKKIIITFFSPSGYMVRKNYEGADHVFYLPLDTKANARRFIEMINPEIAVFTKYDYWYHYLNELHKRQIPVFVISAIFRNSQPFFKFYGSLHRRMLTFFIRIFVQDEASKQLLAGIGALNVTVAGDTRFDRVVDNAAAARDFPLVAAFAGDQPVFIAGSTWKPDDQHIATLIDSYPRWKFIIAPHEIRPARISEMLSVFGEDRVLRYSEISLSPQAIPDRRVLLIDNIGMLTSLYRYGAIAYIGGGFGSGLHNTLEAAAFNLPVIFGPEYDRFKEAKDLVAIGAAFTYSTAEELFTIMKNLSEDGRYCIVGEKAGNYTRKNTGATACIVKEISGSLNAGS